MTGDRALSLKCRSLARGDIAGTLSAVFCFRSVFLLHLCTQWHVLLSVCAGSSGIGLAQ